MSTILGPRQTPEEAARARDMMYSGQMGQSIGVDTSARLCNCMGPQPGETKCPCMLAAEMKQGFDMITNGITIGGKRYRLVPEN